MSKDPCLEELSFDAVLPSAILLNENIEPNAIKLYAFVRGLTKVMGYCYASNEYLSKCMKCDESTVKRLLKSLKEEGFIEIHTNKEGIHWQRHIYVGMGFNKCLRRLKNELPPAQNQAPPSSKMSHNRRYSMEDIENKETPPTPLQGDAPNGAVVRSFGKFVKMTEEEYSKLCEVHGEPLVVDMIEQVNDYLASSGKKSYKDFAAAIRQWIRRRKDVAPKMKPQSNSQMNLAYFKEVRQKYPDTYKHYQMHPHAIENTWKKAHVVLDIPHEEFKVNLHRLFGVRI
jgi:DNA-binding MarR family transcriptional regulator